jgi:ribosomal protein L20A (L18A)
MAKRWYEATCYTNNSPKSQKIQVMAIDKEQALDYVYCQLWSDRKNKQFKITSIKEV